MQGYFPLVKLANFAEAGTVRGQNFRARDRFATSSLGPLFWRAVLHSPEPACSVESALSPRSCCGRGRPNLAEGGTQHVGGDGFPRGLPARASRASFSRGGGLRSASPRAPSSPGPQAQPRPACQPLLLRLPPGLLLSVSLKLPSTLAEDARRPGLLAAAVGTVTWAAIAAFPPLFRALPPPARPRPRSPSLPPSLPQAHRTCLEGQWLRRLSTPLP